MSENEKRVEYCKKHNVHHLFELLATKVIVDRPENPFAYLRCLLESVEQSEAHRTVHDPTKIQFNDDSSPKADAKGDAPKKHLKKITLGTFGLNGAGKTTMLSALSGSIETDCTPTVGFTPLQFQTDDCDICVFDLGGANNFRGIWVHYYHDCHGIMYMIDTAADEATIKESLSVLRQVVEHPYVKAKPLLLLLNKVDLPGSRRESVLPDGFLTEILPPATPHRVELICALREDSALDGAIEWLLQTVLAQYQALSARVAEDSARVKEEKDRERARRLAALRAE